MADIQTKIRTKTQGDVTDVLVLVDHPMETGQRPDPKDKDKKVPAHYIQKLTFSVNGKEVVSSDLGPAMKKILMLLAALGVVAGTMPAAMADPASDLKQFQAFFKNKFPTVAFDEYSNGLYALPGLEEYREQWTISNEFPPYELGLSLGKKLWETPFKNGKNFANCFKNGGKNIAQGYPYWDEGSQKIRTAEMDLMY